MSKKDGLSDLIALQRCEQLLASWHDRQLPPGTAAGHVGGIIQHVPDASLTVHSVPSANRYAHTDPPAGHWSDANPPHTTAEAGPHAPTVLASTLAC